MEIGFLADRSPILDSMIIPMRPEHLPCILLMYNIALNFGLPLHELVQWMSFGQTVDAVVLVNHILGPAHPLSIRVLLLSIFPHCYSAVANRKYLVSNCKKVGIVAGRICIA